MFSRKFNYDIWRTVTTAWMSHLTQMKKERTKSAGEHTPTAQSATQKASVINHNHAAAQRRLCVFTQTHTYTFKRMGLCDINRISSSSLNSAVALFHTHVNRNPIHHVGQARTHAHAHYSWRKTKTDFSLLILFFTWPSSQAKTEIYRLNYVVKDCKNHTKVYSTV